MRIELDDCLVADRRRLKALLRDLKSAQGAKKDKARADFDVLAKRSSEIVQKRRARLPKPEYDEDLPVNTRRAEIARLIAEHQVVIVCGETGSGKTTQLPKICLELGRGATGLIGHTQPRRIAARSTAARIAQELKTELGSLVGYKIRFTERTIPETFVKLMTDGILLAETQGDPTLSQYDTLIIDEAHERSLNIDFLLGYLKTLLPKRPDLKVIITSATIDAERFSKHFNDAPVIEVSGRLFPVEVRYRPVETEEAEREDQRDLYDALVDACDELHREGPGDVLVFLPGEREIRDAAEALRKHHPPHTEILPLFARLSAEEQSRIFKPHSGRRIVLATNVAETSLTVPGIRYVVDTGLARVKRYSYRNKVEQLQVEKISQAAANQRAGRCGRVAAGICIRLYDETGFKARPAFTDPEILRSSLAGVILRMKSLHLGDIEQFPFLEAPSSRAIADGYQLLQELNALDAGNALTGIGHGLAKLPLDPRIGRMIVAARDGGCLKEVLVIAAALSVQDPRERPQEKQGTADAAHAKWADEKSEFLSWLKLWNWYGNEIEHKKSQRKLVQVCHASFLSANRMREWRDVYSQLHALMAELGWIHGEKGEGEKREGGREKGKSQLAAVPGERASHPSPFPLPPSLYDAIHKALLTGLLGNLGCRSEDSMYFLGAHGIKFLVHPSSPLQKKVGRWLMASEITETTKLYARCIARVDPLWLEEVGAHLIRRSYFDPHWEQKAMQVAAWERSTLYGIVVNPKKRVNFGPMNPAEAREIFIRQGLVGGEINEDFARRWPFWQHNRKLIREIESLEHKSRRPDVLVDDELIYAFYDHVIPEGIHNGADFDKWRKEAERENAKLLFLKREDLMRHEAAGVTTDAFPSQLKLGGVEYALTYHFEPGSPKDGVTLTVPLPHLNQVPALRCEWLVPGLLKEKVQQLVKTLPQKIRAKLVPVPEFAAEFAEKVQPADKGLVPALIAFIMETRGLNARGWAVTPDAFRPGELPAHLSMNFKLVDEHGRQLDMRRNLTELRAEWGGQAKTEFAEKHEAPSEFSGLTDWSFGELPELMEVEVGGQMLLGYPGLTDDGESVSLKVFDSPEEARAAHEKGLVRLFKIQFREQLKYFEKNLPGLPQMGIQAMGLMTVDELKQQLIDIVFARACLTAPLPQTEAQFRTRCSEAKSRLGLLSQEICRLVGLVLSEWQALMKKLPAFKAHAATVKDIEAQVARLMGKRFVAATPFERLQHYPRYLKAAALRLDKLKADPARDARLMAEYAPLWTNYERRVGALAKQGMIDENLEQFRWLLEELRVSLFAQELKTPTPVSPKRLQKTWEGLARA